ncbi:hypothetical protein RN04_14495 [Arthrobacter sp. W1]|nr:hypothetical protein RN04_14495 [Arthrobacter sp. W1]
MSRYRDGSRAGFSHFSTQRIPAQQRVGQWEAHHASQLVGLRAMPLGPTGLEADATSLKLPRLRLANVTGSAHAVLRKASDIASHPVGGAVIYLPLASESSFRHHAGTTTLTPEQGIICDGDLSFSRYLSRGVSELVLRVPRQALREATGLSSLGQAMLLDLQTRGGPGRELVRTAKDSLAGHPGDWDQLEHRLLELVGELTGAQSRRTQSHLSNALHAIARQHTDPGFDAQALARAIGLSDRQLSRIMAEAGRSLPQTLLRARLESARAMLADPALSAASMAEIAEASGFKSQAQFSRSYSKHFGTAPLRDRRLLSADRGHPGS